MLKEYRDLVLRGESDREPRAERDEENTNFWLNNIWSDEELTNFFEAYDLTPYSISVHRPLLNNLISKQRQRKITFDFLPTDIHSYHRHRDGRDQFIQEELAKENPVFTTSKEAGEFYDKYADDKYANAVTATMHNIRLENKAKYVETEVFQQGLISGLDFFKCIYGRKWNRNGGIEITRRPQRAVFYDETSTEYDLSDIEFIGEVHKLYKQQLKTQYPDFQEEIEEYFKEYTNKERPTSTREMAKWNWFYDFNYANTSEAHLRVSEIWTLENEERFVVFDNQNNEQKVVNHGVEEDAIYDDLMSMVLIELNEEAKTNPEIEEIIASGNAKQYVADVVEERFEIDTTVEPIWYKTVFSYNCLFEHERTPLPHGSHPYIPFFAQFMEGEFTSMMDDIKDIVIAINKALAFRELMMAHGSKGLVIIDEKAFANSQYSIDDIAEQYASIGGMLALKLKPGQSIRDVIDSITTVGDGLEAINNILADLDNRLFHISGVTMEQLGVVQRQTTNSGYRAQVQEGEINNGLIFDNFYRSLETFYSEKVIPLIVETMKEQPKKVIRRIGDNHAPWIEVELEEDFGLFDTAVRSGQYNTVLRPITDNPQIQEERSSKYMEMAMAGLLDPEIAIEFSTDPEKFKLLKAMKEKERERIERQAYNQFTFEEFYQVAASSGLPMTAIEELVDEMKRAKVQEMAKDQTSGEQKQRRQGGMGQTAAPVTRQSANENQRLGKIGRAEQ
jgi:hypothetical protein